ncbi:MAG: extensin family protein, partial [Tistlia sp.]
PLAAALQLWMREVVQPAARRYLDAEVARIGHLGSYACRRVYGRAAGRPSQHATANAIDIAGFRLADGRRVSVLGGWQGTPAEQAFLKDLHAGACSLFRGVLGPDYNAAHRDHFHLEMGPYGLCR